MWFYHWKQWYFCLELSNLQRTHFQSLTFPLDLIRLEVCDWISLKNSWNPKILYFLYQWTLLIRLSSQTKHWSAFAWLYQRSLDTTHIHLYLDQKLWKLCNGSFYLQKSLSQFRWKAWLVLTYQLPRWLYLLSVIALHQQKLEEVMVNEANEANCIFQRLEEQFCWVQSVHMNCTQTSSRKLRHPFSLLFRFPIRLCMTLWWSLLDHQVQQFLAYQEKAFILEFLPASPMKWICFWEFDA